MGGSGISGFRCWTLKVCVLLRVMWFCGGCSEVIVVVSIFVYFFSLKVEKFR